MQGEVITMGAIKQHGNDAAELQVINALDQIHEIMNKSLTSICLSAVTQHQRQNIGFVLTLLLTRWNPGQCQLRPFCAAFEGSPCAAGYPSFLPRPAC